MARQRRRGGRRGERRGRRKDRRKRTKREREKNKMMERTAKKRRSLYAGFSSVHSVASSRAGWHVFRACADRSMLANTAVALAEQPKRDRNSRSMDRMKRRGLTVDVPFSMVIVDGRVFARCWRMVEKLFNFRGGKESCRKKMQSCSCCKQLAHRWWLPLSATN